MSQSINQGYEEPTELNTKILDELRTLEYPRGWHAYMNKIWEVQLSPALVFGSTVGDGRTLKCCGHEFHKKMSNTRKFTMIAVF